MAGGRFRALTADMYGLDYRAASRPISWSTPAASTSPICGAGSPSCRAGTPVLLQSNDYFGEPTPCQLRALAGALRSGWPALRDVDFSGELRLKNYTRFMLIGAV